MHKEAQPFIDRAIVTSSKFFGPDHTMTGAMLLTLALQLFDQDKVDEAERLYMQALPISEKSGGLRAEAADNYIGLGLVEVKRKNWRKAYTLLSKASAIAIALEKVGSGGDMPTTSRRVAPNAVGYLLNAIAAYHTAELEPEQAAALRDHAFELAQRSE